MKEELFIICNGKNQCRTPHFSSHPHFNYHTKKQYIISADVLSDCVKWLEKNKLKKTTIYLGLYFDKPKHKYESCQRNWEIDPKLMSRIVKLKATLCVSMYDV